MIRGIYFLFFLSIASSLNAQLLPLSLPVKIPIDISGNFGELRDNHFHAGIDIKTQGRAGLPVVAPDSGFVSRITISPSGYGNALYVDHPNGLTTVFGHLDHFAPEIQKWVRENQYKLKKFDVTLIPDNDQFIFKKGQIMAYSGNTGSSSGPHLHYEVRNTSTQITLNPQVEFYHLKDKTKPVIQSLYVYPVGYESQVEGTIKTKRFDVVTAENRYRLKENQTIKAYGDLAFGIQAYDRIDGSMSKLAIYRIELWVDDEIIYSFKIDELDYDKMRGINSFMDYETDKRTHVKAYRCVIDNNSKLNFFKQNINGGIYSFIANSDHKVTFKLYDANHNESLLSFNVKATSPIEHPEEPFIKKFSYNSSSSYETDDIKIEVPTDALFTNINFTYKKSGAPKGSYSELHEVLNPYVPLYKPFNLKIKATALPDSLIDKAVIVSYNPVSKSRTYVGGKYSFGWVEATSNEFGNFYISVDNTPPTIVPLSIANRNTLTDPNRIRFKISDALSGISEFNGFVDGKWVLFEYDYKSHTITYTIDDKIEKGKKHELKLVVIDKKENIASYIATFKK